MSCVNKSSREFKKLMQDNNVSSNTLELIVHKYWLETGSEENFPTDVYIQAQLGNGQYKESISAVRKLWQRAYKHPQSFNTLKDVERAYDKALSFFPAEAIYYYKNRQGGYTLTVKQPVTNPVTTAKTFFEADGNVRKLDLGLQEGVPQSVDNVQKLYNQFNNDRTTRRLADKVFSIAKEIGIQITFNESLPGTTVGRYTNNNSITYRKSFFEKDANASKKAPIILHEMIHAVSMYALSDQTADWHRTAPVEKFRRETYDIFEKVRYNKALEGERGTHDVFEFVAELSNPIFRQKLQSIDGRKWYTKILDAFKSLFGIHSSSTYYNRMMNALDGALEAFDMNSYMEYNGMKLQLQQAYNDHRVDFEEMSESELKTTFKNAVVESEFSSAEITPVVDQLKPQYRGKLIYAQSGTGKSTIADNVTVFDSDFLLGEVLGVSPETAGFFFHQMSTDQKKAFGQQYRDLIRQKIAEGKTVLTANEQLMDEADVIVYNQSAEQTEKRANSSDRAITNQYSALNYHRDTLEHVQNLKQNDKNKEYIELGEKAYLADHLLSNMVPNSSTAGTTGSTGLDNTVSQSGRPNTVSNGRGRGLGSQGGVDKTSGLTQQKLINNFLNTFGITVNHLDDYENDVPLFDALNRVINARTADDITDGMGYAIAFMMQADPEMMRIIHLAHGGIVKNDKDYVVPRWLAKITPEKGILSDPGKLPIIGQKQFEVFGVKFSPKEFTGYRVSNLTGEQLKRRYPWRNKVIKAVGDQIAQELKQHFKEDYNNIKTNSDNHGIWHFIKKFFSSLGKIVPLYRNARKGKQEQKLFVADIIDALSRGDFSRIQSPLVKPETTEKAERVFIEDALKENPFEADIIKKLNKHGIALAGSASIALEGTLYRPTENPLHDIDFNAGDGSSKEKLDTLLPQIFGKDKVHFASWIVDDRREGNDTVTYVVLDRPFTVKQTGRITAKYYDLDGNFLGERVKYSEIKLQPGVKGKMLDFFVGPNKGSEYGTYKTTLNGDEYLISNSNGAMAAKILWARTKDMWDYKHLIKNDFNPEANGLASFIGSMSKDQLVSQLKQIKQEYADFELINDTQEESKKPVNTTFKFNDGTEVRAPFKPNDQQAEALNTMSDFLNSSENTMTLAGYAGTGKTSVMEILARKARRDGKYLKFCATTNQAANVLSTKLEKLGLEAQTLNKVFGISVEIDSTKAYDTKNLVNVLREADVEGVDAVVIDEASMINTPNYNILKQIAEANNVKIIYVGDRAQLAPVGEDKVSPVFRNSDGKVIELTKVERTDDNAVLKEATRIRNGEGMSYESSFNKEGKGVAFLNPDGEHRQDIVDTINHFIPGLKKDPNHFRILSYTNESVEKYNKYVRKKLGYDSTPQKGEPIIGYANWGYNWRTKTYRFINSGAYTVINTRAPEKKALRLGGKELVINITPLYLKDSNGHIEIFDFIDIKNDPTNRQAAILLATMKKQLRDRVRNASKVSKRDLLQQINDIDRFLFVNDNILDDEGHSLQTKTFDFGYAHTIHTSQGSTFTHVLLDAKNIERAPGKPQTVVSVDAVSPVSEQEAAYNISNDPTKATMIGTPDEMDLGLGEETSVNTPTATTNNDVADIRQQLEYVGMSRATDTVTVITNDAKKEDSALNHLKEKGADKPVKETPRPEVPAAVKNAEQNDSQLKITLDEFNKFLHPGITYRRKDTETTTIASNGITVAQAHLKHKGNGDADMYFTKGGQKREIIINPEETTSFCFLRYDFPYNVYSGDIKNYYPSRGDTAEPFQIHTLVHSGGRRWMALGYDRAYTKKVRAQLSDNINWSDVIERSFEDMKVKPAGDKSVVKTPSPAAPQKKEAPDPITTAVEKWRKDPEHRVNLAGYEYFNDLYEDTVVDAEWKVPMLLKLDHQLSTTNDQNTAILDRMEAILKTPSKEALERAPQQTSVQSYTGDIAPDANTVFVFGSNPEGRHGAGAAKVAREKFGAQYGVGEGLTGNAYALPTKDLRVKENNSLRSISEDKIVDSIKKLYETARQNPDKQFKVAYRNTDKASLNGYTGLEMIDMFLKAGEIPSNMVFSKEWVDTGKFDGQIQKSDNTQPNQDSTPLDAASQHEITNQLVDHLKGMGITVKGRADIEKSLAENPEEFRVESIFGIDNNYLNQDHLDIIPDIQKIIEGKKYNKAGTDVVKLEGDNKIYLIDHSTDEEYQAHRREGRHGVGIRKVYDLDNLTTNDIKEIIRNAAPGYEYSANRVRHLLQTLGIEEGHMSGIDFDAEIRKAANAGTDAVHGQKRQGKGAGYYGFRGYNNNGGEGGRTSQRPVGQSQERQLFVTPNGEVYGFINKDGEIYLDETKISPEHPIHEYTHLWDNTVIQRNPALWNRGKALMKEIPLWNEILNDPNYGKKWQAMDNVSEALLEQLVASEVHARLVGESGKVILEKLAKSKGTSGIVAKLKQWLLDVYKYLKGTFTPWTKDELDKLTLKEFNRMTLRDFVQGVNPNVAAKGLRDFTLHSVEGSEWAYTGMVDYRTKVVYHKNSDILSDAEAAEADAHLRKANETLGRTYPTKNNNVNNDFRKSWFQIKDADAVFAVADVDRGSIQGGTAWAVQMAIDSNKPVYVFNQGQNKWFTYRDKAWVETETPMLTPTFAGFEPIELSASGRKAIEDVYQKTYDNAIKTNSNTLSKVEDTTESNSQDNIPDTDISQFFSNDEEMLQWKNSHRIELLGYETWNNLYENTYVDFAWKVPMLRELDERLGVENTQEQNNEIINLMNDVLIAATEDDIKPVSSKKRKEIQKNLDDYEKLNTQFDRLLDGIDGEGDSIEEVFGVKFTASQLRHVAELVGDHFSDLITKIQTEEGAVKEMFPLLSFKEDVDFTTMSREKVVETVGIQNLINYLKEGFEPGGSHWFATEDSGENMPKGWLLMENWDAFMTMTSDIIALTEGFSIERDHSNSKFNLSKGEKQQVAYDDFNGYQDEDTLNETEGDAQEYWQVESRTIDVLNSMSALVRQAIHQCYILDSNGNKVMDENWQKLPLRVNARKATNSILRWAQGALTLEDMIAKLQAKQADNPWVSQLIDRLSDKTGKEADFQSQFFGVFAKHFQLYNVVQLDNGKYTSMPVNSHPALSEALTSINAQIKMGEHPLFYANGKIKADMLGNEKTIGDDAPFNLYQAYHHLDTLVDGGLIYLDKKDYMDNLVNYNEDVAKEAAKWIAGSFRVLGYPVTEEMIMQVANPQTIKMLGVRIGYIVRDLTKELKAQKGKADSAINYDPMAYFGKNNIGGTIRNLLTPVTDSLEDIAVSAFYDSGKMYQSYVTPSFMTKLMQKLKSENKFKFIEEEYGNSEWFRDPKTKEWRLDILNRLPEKFDFKVELNFNKHNYMRNMSDAEYTLSLITEFFADGWNPSGRSESTAWYAMPMQSNKPSSEFVRLFLYKDEGGGSLYKDTITNKLYKMFLQELSRIQTVNMRGLNPKTDSEAIKNFDTNGRKFCFLPFLNGYLKEGSKTDRNLLRNEDNTVSEDNETLARLLQRKLEGLESSQLSADEEATLVALTKKAIQNYMEARAAEIMDSWERSGIVEAARSIKNIVKGESFLHSDMKQDDPERNKWVKESLEMFLWNDYLAKKQILQLTVGDIAFYKDMEDLQKRLSQLHAPGIRGNIYATDYQGNRVSDGKYRTLVLTDWDNFQSNIIDNIAEVFDRKIAAAPESQKAQMRALKESLVGENGAYRRINVADAQGLSSPSSYRKKAFIFGKWSQHYEDIYQSLLKGDYNYTDLQTAFQPLKPFVYTLLDKSMGVPGAPITRMKVPFQAKNSEYLLIMADAILKGDEAAGNKLGRPNLLKAIYRVMEDSEKLNPTKGIDTVQFESAIKSGLQGRINLHQFANLPGGEEAAYTLMMDSIYKKGADGKRSTEYNVDTFVHEASYEDYCLQQEVPEHFKNHSQAHGSQERMIIPSDLDLYVDDNADHNDPNNINYYEWTEPDGTKRRVNAKEFRQEYEETIAQSISNDIASLQQELHLDSTDKKERNIALSKILQREILSSPRYGVDLLQACSVDKETGEFRMPKGDPIQSKRIEQLLNSIIKNRINKQKIAGGPIVQVSNYGTSKQLNIRFKDKQGNILKTRQEYEQQQEQSELQKVLSGSDRTIDEAKRVLKRGDGKSVQENQLEVYARSKGLWREGEVTEQLEQQYGKKIGHGGESFVYRKDVHTVIKAKDNIYDNVYDALESIQIHNTLFPSTKITLVGIGRSEGELTFIVEQPYVGGREATKKEIQDFVSSKLDGTLDESVLGGHSYQNDIYKLQNLKPANVLVEPNGNLQVIDGDFYLKEEQQQYTSYKEYVKANQAGIAYFEVFAPIWSEELFEKFADENGSIDMAAVENACPELLDMVSYRIPTEDKYSIAPMRVVGFMPREAGDAIMLPYDLTTIDDSDFDVDKRYVMRKTGQIKRKHTSEIFKSMYDIVSQEYAAQHEGKVNKQYLKDQLHMFLNNPEKMKNMDALMKHFNNIYRRVAYTIELPTSGKDYRDNKIIDMTLAVLTNERTADKLLNPGGFEEVAKIGYQIAAYRSEGATRDGLSWDNLSAMSEDELKALSYKSKDIAWTDTQVQFYKQNAATSSMIGIFAVSKIAHAILESNGIYLNLDNVVEPFTVAGMQFGGRMEVDPKYDREGNMIGKVAGSLVSASADGVKKPVLDLMNISPATAGVLNTMLRLGMPLKQAALFMSQDAITRLLKEFNNRRLSNYVTLNSLIDEYMTAFEKAYNITDGSTIKTEELSEKELIEGLKPQEHKTIDYKVMLALSKLLDINKEMKDITFATRFNSISSAVGPLIIDNLILLHKMEQFGLNSSGMKETNFCNAEGDMIDIEEVFDMHPILREFSKAVSIAANIFSDMPAGSKKFKDILDGMPDYLQNKMYGDRKLLSQLSDFYQSYLLVASGLIDTSQLKYYMEEFPKEFISKNYKEKYSDNMLIQAIKPNVYRKSNRAVLEIKTTGMDTQQKEELSSAWIDLHKEDPELSKKLFIYNFFKAGIGFSPKTFMSLVPMYVKEKMSNGDATYVGTFRSLPKVTNEVVVDQFVRNNWNDNKLVPWKGGKNSHFHFDYKSGIVEVYDKNDIKDLNGTVYFKNKANKTTYLWRLIKSASTQDKLFFERVAPLGNNGEYFEVSKDTIQKTLTDTTESNVDNAPAELQEQSSAEESEANTSVENTRQGEYSVQRMLDLLAMQNPALKGQKGVERLEDMKASPNDYAKFLVNVFKNIGLELSPKEALEEFKKYC